MGLGARASLVFTAMGLGARALLVSSAMGLGVGGVFGCAGSPPRSAPPAPVSAYSGTGADLVAQEVMGARVTMLVHVERLRPFRFTRHVAAIAGWGEVLRGTDIDSLRDVRRAFVAMPALGAGRAAVVVEHTASEARVALALARLRSDWRDLRGGSGESGAGDRGVAARLAAAFPEPERLPFPAAFRMLRDGSVVRRGPVLLAAPRPGLLVAVPPEAMIAAFRLADAPGLPEPSGVEAIALRAWEPRASLGDGPLWPAEMRYAELVLAFDATGAGVIRFRGACATEAAARAHAAVMTVEVERAQAFTIGGARLLLFDHFEFRAEADRVVMSGRLFAEDVDWLFAMTMAGR